METSRGLSDEARFELAAAAAGRARRNRPTALLVFAGLALVVSLVGAAWGFSARATARAAFTREQHDNAEVQQLTAEWARLDKAEHEAGDTGVGKPLSDLYSRIQTMARNAGMKETTMTPRTPTNETRPGGLTVTTYPYADIKDPELKALMQWMANATSDIPGLELYEVKLSPDANNWTLGVTFRRWTKTGS
jgi:hypothetical protein